MVHNREKAAKADRQAKAAEKLRRVMRSQGLRQVEVAHVLGLDPTQMSKYMNGHVLWSAGLDDFEVSVGAAIKQAVSRRAAAA